MQPQHDLLSLAERTEANLLQQLREVTAKVCQTTELAYQSHLAERAVWDRWLPGRPQQQLDIRWEADHSR